MTNTGKFFRNRKTGSKQEKVDYLKLKGKATDSKTKNQTLV